ncbi:MAG: UDPGP type 1 family protein [Planctomycetaceae bacterium]|jgi:UDP-N-acetylglucosamine/UDP-N-acetylgalactosamine diphosphorylase|nr:UDPGP type 1 family protein [Planctomycetaceae bacterium]
MTDNIYQSLLEKLTALHQEHLLAHWDSLDSPRRMRLAEQIHAIDFVQLSRLYQERGCLFDVAPLAAKAQEPPAFRLEHDGNTIGNTVGNAISRQDAIQAGRKALSEGQVAVLVVAGGQGTRLGFEHPKGMFPIAPVSGATLFQIHFEKVLARSRQYGNPIPFCVMTSPATHEETVDYVAENRRFGLAEADVITFCQGTMPAVSLADGKTLLAAPDQIALSPDGHGGMLAALKNNGVLKELSARGIRRLFYFQVDNPLVDIANEEFLGYHILAESELTSQVIRKQSPHDRVGNIVSVDGRLHVIEYSDLPDAVAERRKPDGSLEIWAGSIAVHVMNLDFLERQADNAAALPFHVAKKKTPFVTPQGDLIKPSEPNAIKFERFIFDLLPSANNAAVVEVDSKRHFAPLKNASGSPSDSPETVRKQVSDYYAEWLIKSGATVAPAAKVEVSPLFALSAETFAEKVAKNGMTAVTADVCFR